MKLSFLYHDKMVNIEVLNKKKKSNPESSAALCSNAASLSLSWQGLIPAPVFLTN